MSTWDRHFRSSPGADAANYLWPPLVDRPAPTTDIDSRPADQSAGAAVDPNGYAVSPDCSREEFLAVAKVYARAVVAEHDFAVSVSDLSWEGSTRRKRRAGAVRYRNGDPKAVVLTWAQFQNQGWTAAAATLRHELVHVHLSNEADDASHGPAFERLAERLHTHVHCERFVPPEWWVVCTDCGARLPRYRRWKLVTDTDQYQCGNCGGRFRVERNADAE
jgi:predicted SprT family Zn-dependent metalloprotease